jgi:hypothetical protein
MQTAKNQTFLTPNKPLHQKIHKGSLPRTLLSANKKKVGVVAFRSG